MGENETKIPDKMKIKDSELGAVMQLAIHFMKRSPNTPFGEAFSDAATHWFEMRVNASQGGIYGESPGAPKMLLNYSEEEGVFFLEIA